jgi:glycosidase
VGDLNGITERLDYLQMLGVDAIWLTPVCPSPQVDFGYDISDYRAVDPQYGTLADFDRLVKETARRHIRVIMDMVMNHTSDQHRWFLELRSSRTNPYRDWYVWRDGERTPMQWNPGVNTGFTTGKPWLPVPPTAATVNVQVEENDPGSLLAWYRSLIWLKKTNAAIERGDNLMLNTSNAKVLSWEQHTPAARPMVVSVNFTAELQTVSLAAEVKGGGLHTLLKSIGGADPVTLDHIELAPFGVYVGEVQ